MGYLILFVVLVSDFLFGYVCGSIFSPDYQLNGTDELRCDIKRYLTECDYNFADDEDMILCVSRNFGLLYSDAYGQLKIIGEIGPRKKVDIMSEKCDEIVK